MPSNRGEDWLERAPIGTLTLNPSGQIIRANPEAARLMGRPLESLGGQRLDELTLEGVGSLAPFLPPKAQDGERRVAHLSFRRPDATRCWIRLEATCGEEVHAALIDVTREYQQHLVQSFLVRAGRTSGNESIFIHLARFLGESLELDNVRISRLEGDSRNAHTVAVWNEGQVGPNVTFSLAETPFGSITSREAYCLSSGVRDLFPNDPALLEANAECYVGALLVARSGETSGLVSAIGKRPLADPEGARQMIELIAVRASGELERITGEAQYRRLVELSPIGIATYQDGVFTYANPRALEIMGATKPEQLLGRSVISIVHPESRALVAQRMSKVAEGQVVPPVEEKLVRLDGSTFYAEVTAQGTMLGSRPAGQVLVRDITDRKKAEDERLELERQLLYAQKLESLGVLAGGIAHDFNNLLMVISANAELAKLSLDPTSPAAAKLTKIQQASGRAAELAKQMLAYSGRGQFVVEPLDLNRLLSETVELLEVSVGRQAKLSLSLAEALPRVDADGTQLRQVVMNLVINAAEALEGVSGTINVTTAPVEYDPGVDRRPWLGVTLSAGPHVSLSITDTGCGMTPEVRDRLFDPFFTTKFAGRGLGMAAVLGIVRRHEGAIRVETAPGQGTTFELLLPASASAFVTPDAPTRPALRGKGRALVVDDEPLVLEAARELLLALGYEVEVAASGGDALGRFTKGLFRFVLLDLTMPGVSGQECLIQMKAMDPGVKVVLSSGYDSQDVTDRRDLPLDGFIQKPYTLEALRAALMNSGVDSAG